MESQKKNQRKLRNLIVNPRYQLRYTMWLTLSGIILVALNGSLFYHFIRENYLLLVELSPMTDEARNQLYSELNSIILYLCLISGGFLALTGAIGVVLSHRTAGAMYHFKKIFLRIAEGDVKARIHLRPKDDFQDVAAEFNKLMDRASR